MSVKNNHEKGFTLLIAVVVTSMLLLISFVVANIALKQVVLSNDDLQSQYAFYNADSGTECALYWDLNNPATPGVSAFATSTPSTISCNTQSISSGSETVPNIPSVPSLVGGGGSSNPTSIFWLNFNTTGGTGCAIVQVTKNADGSTNLDSRGYNTCNTSSGNRLERGVTLTY